MVKYVYSYSSRSIVVQVIILSKILLLWMKCICLIILIFEVMVILFVLLSTYVICISNYDVVQDNNFAKLEML